MGNSNYSRLINAANQAFLGLDNRSTTLNISRTSKVVIQPLEMNLDNVRTGNAQVVRFSQEGSLVGQTDQYFISRRSVVDPLYGGSL